MVKTKISTHDIEQEQLYDCIRAGFYGDDDLKKYYDESCDIQCHEDMIFNTSDKLNDYPNFFENTKAFNVKLGEVCIGYFYVVENPAMLVSFAISKDFRSKENLINFFDMIKSKLNDSFTCMLFKKNSRAISWLIKCGMSVDHETELIVKLKY